MIGRGAGEEGIRRGEVREDLIGTREGEEGIGRGEATEDSIGTGEGEEGEEGIGRGEARVLHFVGNEGNIVLMFLQTKPTSHPSQKSYE